MKKHTRNSAVIVTGIVALLMLTVVQPHAQPFPPGPDNDDQFSLGIFRIYIQPQFRPLIEGLGLPPCDSAIGISGCYDGLDTFRLTSPVLLDQQTIIARSNPHVDGSGPDAGTPTGTGIHATVVGDADFSLLPPFEGPPGRTEVHTAVADLEMMDLIASGILVRAGHTQGLPLCPGEVESKTGTDLPGESFFNIFVEVTLPMLAGGVDGILMNPPGNPLLIVNDSLDSLPPTVVYIHENSNAVPVRFVNDNPPHWNAGELLGFLVLAGHGYNYGGGPIKDAQASLPEFLDIMNEHASSDGEMPLPPEACCVNRGNADGVLGVGGPVDVADLTFLVAYLFQNGPTPPCIFEGNVDAVLGVGGPIDVADLTFLVSYLFQSGPPPPVC